jgi:hypothetical protein
VKNRRVNPMASVAAITAAALVGVVVLAVQAAGSAPKVAKAQPAATQPAQPTASLPTNEPPPTQAPDPNALPTDTGTGKRFVYSISGSKVWLVDATNTVQRVIQAVPGTITPPVGKYKTNNYRQANQGGDGVSVQYVVYWGPKFGFDAVSGVSGLPAKPTKQTGAVRMSQDDALALWSFADGKLGLPVVVVS